MTRLIPIFFAAAVFLVAGAAQAAHDQATPAKRLRASAQQLEQAADRLHHRVAARAQRGNHRARQVLPALVQLERRAEGFRDQIQRRGNNLNGIQRRHDRLENAYRTAYDCARQYGMHRLASELASLGRLVERTDRQVEQVRVARYQRNHRPVERHARNDRRERDRWEVASRWPRHFGWYFDRR